jgi:membrane protein CcdC involved in cytochrome C biogenesis
MPDQLLLLAIVMTVAFAYFALTGRLRAYPGKSKWILVSLFFLWVGLLVHYLPMFLHKG